MPSLRDHLTSSYLDAAHRLASKTARRRVVAYVESYEDVAFWRNLLSTFETDRQYFQVMLPSTTSLSKGKKTALMNVLKPDSLGGNLIACVDSDYDFLLQGATEGSHRINSSPYVFQTYVYSIENYHCYAEALHEVCVQATLNDRPLFDFVGFLRRYSLIVHPLFVWNIFFYRMRDTHSFPMHEFHNAIALGDVNIHKPEEALAKIEQQVKQKLRRLERKFRQQQSLVKKLTVSLERLGLTSESTYLYIQGHHLTDNVVMKLLTPVCTALRREREEEIKRLAVHELQFQNEMTAYENSLVNVGTMLKRHTIYEQSRQYAWMQQDVEEFLQKTSPTAPPVPIQKND